MGVVVLALVVLACQGCAGSGGTAKRAAAQSKSTIGEFGSYGTGAGQFREPFGIAIDERNGYVYVVDSNNSRIEKFTSSGRFLLGWGWGVADGTTRALQTCTRRCFAGIRGAGAGQFDFSEGVAVDNDPSSSSYGDVYVVDIYNARVEKFSPNGQFLLMFGGGVNRSARQRHEATNEDVCPVRPGDICGAGTQGQTPGQLDLTVEGSFIAVASDGTVHLGQHSSIDVFSADGRYLRRISLAPEPVSKGGHEAGGVSGLAVNGAGDSYVIRSGVVGVNEYAPRGRLMRTLEQGDKPAYPEGPTPALALDPTGNVFIDVYSHERHRIDEFGPDGALLGSFDQGPRASPYVADREDGLPGMAYDPRTRALYVVNADVNLRPRVARVRMVAPPRP